MDLTRRDVEHVALLARLGLTGAEVETLRSQMSSILSHVNQLGELETAHIPPTAQVIAVHDVMAADEPRPSCTPDDMLANAPEREGNYFKTKAVLGYET